MCRGTRGATHVRHTDKHTSWDLVRCWCSNMLTLSLSPSSYHFLSNLCCANLFCAKDASHLSLQGIDDGWDVDLRVCASVNIWLHLVCPSGKMPLCGKITEVLTLGSNVPNAIWRSPAWQYFHPPDNTGRKRSPGVFTEVGEIGQT